MSKALAESCCLHSASLLTIFCTRIIPVGTPAAGNSAISTSGAGPLGNAVERGGGAERRDQTAMAAAAIPPLNRKARRVTLCRAASSLRSDSNISTPSYWTHHKARSYSHRETLPLRHPCDSSLNNKPTRHDTHSAWTSETYP